MEDLPDHLEVDNGDYADSTLGSETYTLTTSLSPSVKEFRHENGRRYHSFDETAYYLPNDDIEAARLDLQHYTWKVTFNGTHGRAPIGAHTKRVLDVGTGTGIWAIELAEAYPETEVVGTDLSPIQPDFVPPNCHFIVDHAEADWAFERKFDYVHSRLLTAGMHDWERFFRQCWDSLAPGGWLEANETIFPPRQMGGGDPGGDPVSDSAFIRWGQYACMAGRKVGIDTRISDTFKGMLEAQGFVNVSRADIQWPIKPWAKGKKNKIMGKLVHENTQSAVPGIAMAFFTRVLGWTKEEVDKFTEEALAEVNAPGSHFFYPMVSFIAQKPETAKSEE